MATSNEYEEYLVELREHVCSRCIERQPDCPPCSPHAKGCEGSISWALYSRDKAFFNVPTVRRAISGWPDGSTAEIVWTDKDSNLVSIINWRGE